MHPIVNIAVSAARAAGSIILRHLDQVDRLPVETKGSKDFVTAVDRAAEQEIIGVIRRAYPDHAILGEESGSHGSGHREWIIDPLDGTTNYLHRFGHFCVSIGFRDGDELRHGVIYDPLRDELFTASQGEGAQLNNRRLRVSARKSLDHALIATGVPFGDPERLDAYLPGLRAVAASTAGIRRAGSAALDLAWVAAGRVDGFWEFGLKPWDVAAGIVLVREAGGAVKALSGTDPLQSGDLVAAGSKLIEPLSSLVQR